MTTQLHVFLVQLAVNAGVHCSAVEEDDFNEGLILPPLVIQLRKILDQYSDETQIFKVSNCIIFILCSSTIQLAMWLCNVEDFGIRELV